MRPIAGEQILGLWYFGHAPIVCRTFLAWPIFPPPPLPYTERLPNVTPTFLEYLRIRFHVRGMVNLGSAEGPNRAFAHRRRWFSFA